MASLIEPDNHSVQELTEALVDIEDEDTLDAILEAELNGKDRKTAKEAIEQRRDAIEPDDHDPEATDQADDESEEAPSAESASDASDESASDDESAATNGEEEDASTMVGSVDADAAALGTLDLAAKQAEVLEGLDREEEISYRILDDLDNIRSAIDATNNGGRFDARIRQLQEEVSDLKAYTNALEEFLDEEGTGQQVIESVKADLETIETDLAEVRSAVRRHGRNIADLWGVLSDVETELTTLDDRLDRQQADFDGFVDDVDDRFHAVTETLDDHADELDALDGQIGAVTDRVDTVSDDLSALEAEMDERLDDQATARGDLASRVEDNSARIDDLLDRLEEIASVVESHEHRLGDSGPVEQRFDELEADIKSIQEWRQQLGSVLTGTGHDPAEAPDQ